MTHAIDTERPAGRRVRVVLIVGGQRSGSTLIARIIGESPGAVALGELWYLWQRSVVEDRLCGCGNRFSRCEFWQRVEAVRSMRGSMETDRLWGDLHELTRNRRATAFIGRRWQASLRKHHRELVQHLEESTYQ